MDDSTLIGFTDVVAGPVEGGVDDVVLQRNDGVPAYNLAVVVDDALQGVTQVVRGDDLLDSTPRQIHLQALLGLPRVEYGHVPLVFGTDGERLSKRHGSVSLEELAAVGDEPADVVIVLLASMGIAPAAESPRVASRLLSDAVGSFDLALTPRDRLVYDGDPAGGVTGSPSFTMLNDS
jgi:glutamyl-tRNA synthetase